MRFVGKRQAPFVDLSSFETMFFAFPSAVDAREQPLDRVNQPHSAGGRVKPRRQRRRRAAALQDDPALRDRGNGSEVAGGQSLLSALNPQLSALALPLSS